MRGAGHIVPYDQPERALDMLDRFIGYSSQWENIKDVSKF